MKLFSLVTEAQFSQPIQEYGFIKDVINLITDNKFNSMLPISEGTKINLKEEGLELIIQNSRIAIALHNTREEKNIDRIKEIYTQLYESLNMGKISRIGVRSQWIEEVNSSFVSLLGKHKKSLFQNVDLVDEATDVSLVLTLKDGDSAINYMSGPMDKAQLMQADSSIDRDYPSRCIFVDVDYYCCPDKEYTNNDLLDYIDRAVSYAKKVAEKTVNNIK